MKPRRMLTVTFAVVLSIGVAGGVVGSFSGAGATRVSPPAGPPKSPVPAPKLPPCPTPTNVPLALPSATAETPPVNIVRRAAEPMSYEVRPGDSLWLIAETHLGQGERWTEVWQLNLEVGRDDGFLSDPDLIRPGWNLLLPADGTVSSEEALSVTISPAAEPGPSVKDAVPSPTRPLPCAKSRPVPPPVV
jgi:hypothetical protein